MKISQAYPRQDTTARGFGGYTQKPIHRSQAVAILEAALAVREPKFARQAALNWLKVYPGDLQVALIHAQALVLSSSSKSRTGHTQAIQILEGVCQTDPEFLEAYEALLSAQKTAGIPDSEYVIGCIHSLGGPSQKRPTGPHWGPLLWQAKTTINHAGGIGADIAEKLVHQALVSEPNTPLAGIVHLQVARQSNLPLQAIQSLAEMYHTRWPTCVQFYLLLAETLMDGGEADRAVSLLHQAAARDVSGQAATRLWGLDHPYRSLWSENLSAPLLKETTVPAAVAAALGWNRLPSNIDMMEAAGFFGNETDTIQPKEENYETDEAFAFDHQTLRSFSTPLRTKPARPNQKEKYPHIPLDIPPVSEELRSVKEELEKVAGRIKKPQLAHTDGRFQTYIVFTSRSGLVSHYGKDNADRIEAKIADLVEAVSGRKNWNAHLFYADDPNGSPDFKQGKIKVKPARSGDPWSMKLALTDLDAALRKQGEMVGALLIVGGPEVVPFHRLPNPVDDDDFDVPSDNPYATRDENYFIPEWPVGRIPGGAGRDPELILKVLDGLITEHKKNAGSIPWLVQFWHSIVGKIWPAISRTRPSLGYTASIWRRASLSVFRPIGDGRTMLVSPPTRSADYFASYSGLSSNGDQDNVEQPESFGIPLTLHPARLGYFNLHGLIDSSEWYGQKDPIEAEDGPDYPVALRPEDISSSYSLNGGKTPCIVFSEACFGAHLEDRQIEDSLALKFLASGSKAVVGSTCIAYGAVNSPLTAADLLGFSFWTYLSEGLPAGEALRRAKIRLAREMHRRQGYLDGEDQKTLISFVYYGDPLAVISGNGRVSKSILRPQRPPSNVKLVCDRIEEEHTNGHIPAEIVSYVKNIVEQYLPGMDGAHLTLVHEHGDCDGLSHECPSSQLGSKTQPTSLPNRKVVTLSKQVRKNPYVHKHYARLTLDSQGKLVKLVVSR
jgi:hypothetical protein